MTQQNYNTYQIVTLTAYYGDLLPSHRAWLTVGSKRPSQVNAEDGWRSELQSRPFPVGERKHSDYGT